MEESKVQIFADLMKKKEAMETLIDFGYDLLPEYRKVNKELKKFVDENIVI